MRKRGILLIAIGIIMSICVSVGMTTLTASADKPTIEYKMGDANLDGSVNTRDVVLIKQSIVGIAELTDEQKIYADTYADGVVNTRDVVLIQQYIVGMDVDLGEVHEHTYSEEWTYDEEYHWHAATCEHDVISENNTHDFDSETIIATCTTDGYTTYTCKVCGYSYTDNIIVATGHTESEWITTEEPTCTEKGSRHKICTVCQEELAVEEISALSHNYGEWFVVTLPTYDSDGLEKRICQNDSSHCETRIIPALQHSPSDWIITKQPTCTEVGSQHKVCLDCEAELLVEEIPAIGHDFIHHNGQSATCTEKGWNAYDTCSRCDYSSYVEISVLGHNYVGVITSPTCTDQGYTTYTCSRCKYSYVSDYIKAKGHSYSSEWSYNSEYHWRVPICGHTQEEAGITDYAEHEYENGTCKVCGAIQKLEVIFYDSDGTIISIQRINYGKTAVVPNVPEKADYYFDVWIGDYTNVTEDTTITASYKKYLTVTFYDYDLSVLETKKIRQGQNAIFEDEPTRNGYNFIGWSASLDNITEDTEVVAQYEIKIFTVTFKMPNEEEIERQDIVYGLCAVEPIEYPKYYCGPSEVTAKAFSGWYFDEVVVDLSKFKITDDVVFKAKYEDVVDKPVIVIKTKVAGEIGNQRTEVNIYLSMPESEFLFAIDLRIDWDGAVIEDISNLPNYLAENSITESNYSAKNKYFTISLANANGISALTINNASQKLYALRIMFKEGSPTFTLSVDSSFLTGTSIDDAITICPELLVVE